MINDQLSLKLYRDADGGMNPFPSFIIYTSTIDTFE